MNKISFEKYKTIDAINYSLLKRIADKSRFYGSVYKDVDSPAMNLGTIVDDLTIPNEDENKYFITKYEYPSASTLVLAKEVVKECMDKDIDYKTLLKLDKKEDFIFKVIEKNKLWNNSKKETKKTKYEDNKSFFNYIEGKLSKSLSISPNIWEKANELSNILKIHNYTKNIFNTGYNQFTYIFELAEIKYKVRLDKLIIDDFNKVISSFDLKTGELFSNSFEVSFYRNRYYLQQALYQIAVLHFLENNYPDYQLDNFKFIYISTTEPEPYPVIWEMSEKWTELGYNGFYRGSKYYKGIKELTDEYLFYQKHSNKIDNRVFKSGGTIKLSLPT
jgi:hypothetical protein